ncbi:MAG TPA: DUF6491 family protein [Rhizomicrobium sp.]|nr:DUF6491 family protein [Rhizomicrobium sp.]
MKIKLLILAGVALLLAPPAMAQSSCLRIDRIYSFNAPDNRTLIVEDDLHQKFKLSLMGTCVGLTFKQGVAFKSMSPSSLACLGPADQVIVRQQGIGAQTCPINSVAPYTAAMEAADKAAAAAKKSGN